MNLFTRGTGAFARLALVLLLVAVVAAPAVASVGDYRCVDATRVYLGNARLFHTPCHVDSDAIYRQIPEYREILEKGLTDRDVQYHFLMKKAAQKFAEAGIIDRPAPLQPSNVMLKDPETGKPTRVRYEVRDGEKVRVAVKSGVVIK